MALIGGTQASMMDDNDALRLAALLCSRLAHELAGPAGAVANGLELSAGGHGIDDANDLTRDACAQLTRRLTFFRRAYGTGEGMTWHEARKVTADYLAETRYHLNWPDSCVEGTSSGARLVLNLVLCAMETTPAGAVLEVLDTGHPAVAAKGELAEIALPTEGNLYQAMSPRDVQPVFTAQLAWSMGLDLDAEVRDAGQIVWHARPIEHG